MGIGSPRPCFLVEWYAPRPTDIDETCRVLRESLASTAAIGSAVQLLMTIAVPGDEVVFAVFGAESADSVIEACRHAGVPAQRLSAAVHTSE